ncbi:OsmC family peroxiredoxin [Amycolatopsis sp. K13G38]|uniref:OsmC family peroxiredoxin n=1 Tax=Amycolatopsis acididurans TaxID=2724524 RepID=A0ABX1IYZ9_9PSEU|nr:OsmC family peroxiredoxin [Amycolatopsis acididurans]NKQ51262.1 OsmC family peroxiredoxin [Amycolatopsis acididurans]
MTDRIATTTWTGALPSGSGTVTLESSKAAQFAVSWPARAEAPDGLTSPEELIAAAHSSCYSMQLSAILTQAGTPPERIETNAKVSFGQRGEGFAITGILLTVRASVPGIELTDFNAAAEQAKQICPVSAALTGTEITLDAALI